MKNKARFLVYQTFIVCLLICSNLLIYSTANSQMLYGDNQAGNIRFGNQARSSLVDFSVGSLDDVNRLDNTQLSNLLGDVNQSGSVTAIDATITLQYVVGAAQLTDAQVNLADVSGNGTVSSLDASLILRRVVDTNYRFPRQDMSYPLAVTIQGEGSVDEAVISTKSEYQYGTAVRLTARADEGWKFSGWSGDISGTDTSVTITVDVAQNVTATFEEARMKLNLTKTGSGEVGVAPEKEYYMPGDSLQLIANPDYGYRFLSWTYGDSTYQKDTVNVVVGTTLDIGVEFEYGEWVSKAPEYDYPNNTVGELLQNHYFPGYYLTPQMIFEKKYQPYINECWGDDPLRNCEWTHRLFGNTGLYLDFNQDGLLDYFAFLNNWPNTESPEEIATIDGIYMLVSDVLGPKPEKLYGPIDQEFYDKNNYIDLELDGIPEVLMGNYQDHMRGDGEYGEMKSNHIVSFNIDGTIKNNLYAGDPTSFHDATTGDINGDGLVDFLYQSQRDDETFGLWFNDGNGGFIKANSNEYFIGLDTFVGVDGLGRLVNYALPTMDLMDLNGDGYLDLVVANMHYSDYTPDEGDEWGHLSHPTRVYWGQGDGRFDLWNDHTDLPLDYDLDKFEGLSPLGFNMIDFNNDGLQDLVSAITPDYGGYVIQLHQNLGGKQFKDVTKTHVIGYYDVHVRNECVEGTAENNYEDGDPSDFYHIRPFDMDDDGDYDLIPGSFATYGCDFRSDIYWENRDGKFYRSY